MFFTFFFFEKDRLGRLPFRRTNKFIKKKIKFYEVVFSVTLFKGSLILRPQRTKKNEKSKIIEKKKKNKKLKPVFKEYKLAIKNET